LGRCLHRDLLSWKEKFFMARSPNLALIAGEGAEPERLSAHFHNVNRMLPADQIVLAIPPETPAREALNLMRDHGYSQLPVVEGKSVLGIFSYRAFALEAAAGYDAGAPLGDLPVEEFLQHERPAFARLTDEFRGLIDVLDVRDCVVVSGPDELIGIVTPMDVLRYLYDVAHAFVLVEEIELALRALIRLAVDNDALFESCVRNALTNKYGDQPPTAMEQLTLDDFIALVRDGRNWAHFEPVFGGTRERARGKLEPVRDLRNGLFHFRYEFTVEDHQHLVVCRDWLLRCIRKVEAREGSSA
jgi:CBS domain-containing protein